MVVQVRELIYREILEYHPQMLADWLDGNDRAANFVYPSAVDNFKRQFAHLEAGGQGRAPNAHNLGQAQSLPRERVREFQSEAQRYAVRLFVTGFASCVHRMAEDWWTPYPSCPPCTLHHAVPHILSLLRPA